ncbi:MAG: hypothetical protein WD069_05140 [Planctomycetales bacterium]
MKTPERDAAFLWDMVSSAREVQQIIHGLTQEEYLHDRMRQLAVERAVEILPAGVGSAIRPPKARRRCTPFDE